jgi:signal transduction histidine kinase
MSDPPAASADYSLRILWSLARWIEEKKGADALEKVAEAAGVRARDFDGSTVWVSHPQFERILAEARALVDDDEAFAKVCAYRFEESYGAIRHMVWALSPQRLYEAAVKVSKQVTLAGDFEIVESARSSFVVRYRSKHPESRLMCLSRRVHWVLGPTMWKLPPAQLDEHACIAKGDAYCEYRVRWFESWRFFPILLGLVVGTLAAWTAQRIGPGIAPWVGFPMLGAALGHVLELRRMHGVNLKLGQELNDVLRDLGQVEAETRSEIFALNQRQREWIGAMEAQVADRTTALEKIVDGLDTLRQSRVSSLRGFSHDLRNPLFVVRGNAQFLRERFPNGAEGDALQDMEVAASQIEAMLSKLLEDAPHDAAFVKLAPKPVPIRPLVEVFRRRLRALVHGRDIKVTVSCTRDAPESIEADPLVFDRIVDNLLTNASKYTHRGSILLELSGTPDLATNDPAGFLTLELSDTGEGISGDTVARIFRPRPVDEPTSAASYGIGLSSVVRLLAQIGGRLDVMTKQGVGTTFWAHFPVRPPTSRAALGSDDNLESMTTRVVTIRDAEGS